MNTIVFAAEKKSGETVKVMLDPCKPACSLRFNILDWLIATSVFLTASGLFWWLIDG
jgi:hypothetical protein